MIRYVLRIIGFILLDVAMLLWGIGEFIFGDIYEASSELKFALLATKADFIKVIHGRAFL